ncbi:partial Serine/threonine-protein kinase PknA, partial [Gammaproteobacteria bacterium]
MSELAAARHRTLDGRYVLLELIARGGMGEVWRAHDAELDRPVAIKRIATERRSDDARVWREARATARLRHPAIVELFEVRKDDDGRPFLVMELIEGVDLATHVRHTGALDAVEAARMVLPILGGLAIAHAANIVHRDLKPENVLLARLSDGSVQPKIVDFGIAQMLEAGTRLTVGL